MKRNLLTIGILLLSINQANAQFLTNVGTNASVNVKKGALVSNFGGINVAQGGKVNNSGNVKVVGNGTTSEFKTGGNGHFILTLNDPTNYVQSTYGQLHITGIAQNNITGIVDKEYRDASHGKYQQIGLPFFDKEISTLNDEINGLVLTNTRFVSGKASGTNLLAWNNTAVREDLRTLSSKTTKGTDYFIVGTKNVLDTYFPTTTTTFKGRPYADGSGVREILADAGKDVNFGTGGNGLNIYRQRYKNYVSDSWAKTDGEDWTGNYGRNIYQYANPFLTNIDLTLLASNIKNEIRGIRYSVSKTATNMSDAGLQMKYINFTVTGGAVGDIEAPIIKPMQEIAIKLRSNNIKPTIDFGALRTFAYEATSHVSSGTTVGAASFKRLNLSKNQKNGTVKQLEVLLLDENKQEIDRTYYVVYGQAETGIPSNVTVQVAASKANAITTFEENVEGGIDNSVKDTYRLYINEANENTFYGKRIPVVVYDEFSNGQKNNAAFIKINVRDNMKFISDNTSTLSSGESFYVNINDKVVEAKQGLILPISADIFGKTDAIGLYYGKPLNENTLSTTTISRLSDTEVVLDNSDKMYKIYFDSSWKKASVEVYDMSGKLVYSAKNIDTITPHTLNLDTVNGVYIVKAISENSEVYVQKIRN